MDKLDAVSDQFTTLKMTDDIIVNILTYDQLTIPDRIPQISSNQQFLPPKEGLEKLELWEFLHNEVEGNVHLAGESQPPKYSFKKVLGESPSDLRSVFENYDIYTMLLKGDERDYDDSVTESHAARMFVMDVLRAYGRWFKFLEPTSYRHFKEHHMNVAINAMICSSPHLFERYGFVFDVDHPTTYVKVEEPLFEQLNENASESEKSKNLSIYKNYRKVAFCDGSLHLRRFLKKPFYLLHKASNNWFFLEGLKLGEKCIVVQLEYKLASFENFLGLSQKDNQKDSFFDEKRFKNKFISELKKSTPFHVDRVYPYEIVREWNSICKYEGPIDYSSLALLSSSSEKNMTAGFLKRAKFEKIRNSELFETLESLMVAARNQLTRYKTFKIRELHRFLTSNDNLHLYSAAYTNMRWGLKKNDQIDKNGDDSDAFVAANDNRFDILSVAVIALNNDIVYGFF